MNSMYRRTMVVCGFFCISGVAAFGATPDYVETQTITVPNPQPFEDLGYSLDVSGGLAIAGAINGLNAANQGTGAAYIYRQTATGQWNQVAKLTPADGAPNDTFGSAVGIDGDWAIVDAKFHGESSSSQQYGAAYIFHRNSDSSWQQVSEYLAPARTTSYFTDVSISGSQAVVTGSFETLSFQSHGVVDVLEQSGPTAWAKTQRIELIAQSSQINDVAIDNGTVFIGGYMRSVSNGPTIYSVEVYKDSPTGFLFAQSIIPPVPSVAFGSSVSVDGNRLLIGASSEAGHGAAYIYDRGPGDVWIEAAHLVPSDLANRYLIGTEVAVHGDFAYVNSWDNPNGLGDGRVYVFERDDVGNWLEIAKLSSPLAQATFGHSLAAVEGQVLIGSGVNFPGAVHVFSQVPEPTTAGGVSILVICLACKLSRARQILSST